MRQFRLFWLVTLAVVALGVVVASSAAAQGLPTAEPTNKENSTDAISVSAPRLVFTNKNKVECTTATTGTSTETGSPAASGEFHITFRGCVGEVSGVKAKCTGLGDANEGESLSLGKFVDVYDTGGTELGVAVLFEVSATHLTCAGLFLHVKGGTQLCFIKEPYVAKTLHEMTCQQANGVQKNTFLNDAGETLKPKLTVTEGEKSQPEAAEESTILLLHLNHSKENMLTVFKMS